MTQWKYYHAPMSIFHALEADEIPRLLNATGHIFIPPPSPTQSRFDEEERIPRIDLALIKQLGLRMCVGKEWHRFPSHYLVPDGVRVDWIKSEFDGMLPGHFAETQAEWGLPARVLGTRVVPANLNDLNREAPELYVRCDISVPWYTRY